VKGLDRTLGILQARILEDLGPGTTVDELSAARAALRQFRKIFIAEWQDILVVQPDERYGGPMADSGWGEGTFGVDANSAPEPHPALGAQFTPDRSMGKNLSEHEHANRVNRLISTYNAATPEQRHSGATWYSGAHRAAVTVASGRDPGVVPEGQRSTKAIKQGVYRPPGVGTADVERAAGVIARLSPSMPAGMNWENNPRAAHELYKMTPGQRAAASEVSAKGSAARRVNGNTSLQHSGGSHIAHATAILEGHETPEENLNQTIGRRGDRLDTRKKAGSFMRNIASPSTSHEVTVDARSAGIASHHRVGFSEVAKDLGNLAGARYHDYEAAHQEAAGIINQHLKAAGKPPIMPHQLQATTWIADKQGQEYGQGNRTHSGGRASFRQPFGQEKTG
jgi:hypothetical protein